MSDAVTRVQAIRDCPFCKIVRGEAPAKILHQVEGRGLVLRPLNPVTEGHVIVIPEVHVANFSENPATSAEVMHIASTYAKHHMGDDVNLITSQGFIATQSVFHLHYHLVPRAVNDRLALPWHSGKHTKR